MWANKFVVAKNQAHVTCRHSANERARKVRKLTALVKLLTKPKQILYLVMNNEKPLRHCQSKSNQSHKSRKQENSGCKLMPFGQSDCSVFLEMIAVGEVAVLVEMVVN